MNSALARLRGAPQPRRVQIDPRTLAASIEGHPCDVVHTPWGVPTSGCVYGATFNFRGELEKLGGAINEPPYAAPPRAPILYIKPANTWIGCGEPIPLPDGIPALRVGAALGIVFGRTATRVSEDQALSFIGG
jgi:5-oxopent-3-ene-1,2,5-tricarboxylate decarboxylase/2-hydroxyhepta-2,4-diene-1,7-dioate isomerase